MTADFDAWPQAEAVDTSGAVAASLAGAVGVLGVQDLRPRVVHAFPPPRRRSQT
jgi:hypothetical protein